MRELASSNPSSSAAEKNAARERLLSLLLSKEREKQQNSRSGICRAPRGGLIPLSYAQERLWFLEQLEVAGTTYNAPLTLRLNGELRTSALEQSLSELVRRHESLRTRFGVQDGIPNQLIDPPAQLNLELVDLTRLNDKQVRERQLSERLHQEQLRKFDLERGPLFRTMLIKLASDEHVLLLAMHHIISDGWSKGILLRELEALYRAQILEATDSLPVPTVQYADYAIWQRDRLRGEKLQLEMAYWKRQLTGTEPLLQLPTDRPRPAVESFKGGEVKFTLPAATAQVLQHLARSEGASLFMVVLALYQVLLHRWSGQRDIVVGSPIAGRETRELEGTVGCFVNMLVLRADVSGDLTFRQFLRRVRDVTFEAYAHQELPFEALVKELRPERSLSAQPIFQAALALHNYAGTLPSTSDLTWSEIEAQSGITHFDLTLHVIERADGISGAFEYAADLFDLETVERMVGHFQVLLHGILQNPDGPLWSFPLLGEAEEQMLARDWNATSTPYDRMYFVHEMFSEHARRAPQMVALVCEDKLLRYGDLEERSNLLAEKLVNAGVGADSVVGVCLERSIEMVVALLGVMKAGGAYLPLSPDLPPQRLRLLVEDAGAALLVARPPVAEWLRKEAGIEIIQVDDCYPEPAVDVAVFRRGCTAHTTGGPAGPGASSEDADSDPPIRDQQEVLLPENLAYVIYTSGSTGRPKGVLLHHRGLSNMVHWYLRRFDLRPGACVSQVASMMFDAMAFEVWPALSSGATLVICPDFAKLSVESLHEWLTRHNISVAFIPTPVAEQMVSSTLGVPASVRYLQTGGDVLHQAPRIPTGYTLVNNYGPTEITVVATTTEVNADATLPIPIGRPVDNAEVHVLDSWMQRVPLGVRGELYVAGTGVARGYLGLPGMTAERFVANPFGPPGTRLYRTGDVVRWRRDGNLEFVGRNDGQIKIRGYRIEQSEIESVLLGHEAVRQALVQVRETGSGQKFLVAYVVPEPAGSRVPLTRELQAYLKMSLPDYMVPPAWVLLDQFPLTPNGKVDTNALPLPESASESRDEYEAPCGDAERTLAVIWQELLSMQRVGRKDNFFRLGGHSLLIMQMIERLRRLGLAVDARRVFETSTLADLAAALSRQVDDGIVIPPNRIPSNCSTLTPEMLPLLKLEIAHLDLITRSVAGGAENIQDIYPLAPIQEGVLFHHLLSKHTGDVYARPVLLQLSSGRIVDEFVRALQCSVDRHDILRTAILWEGVPHPIQVVCRHALLRVEMIPVEPSLGALEELRRCMRSKQQKLDLSAPPLMRLQYARDPGSEVWYALLHTHHLVFDNTSLPILLSELSICLEGRAHTLPSPLPYRDYVVRALAHSRSHDSDAYFRSRLGDIDESTAPFGVVDSHGDGLQLEEAFQVLDPSLSVRIVNQARHLSLSTAALFHAAWAMVLSMTTDRNDVVFGTVLLGRMREVEASRNIVGMLVNSLPIRLSLQDNTVKGLLEQAQQELAALLNYEQSSLADVQRCSNIKGAAPLFTTLLNYLRGPEKSAFERAAIADLQVLESEGGTNYAVTVSVTDRAPHFELQIKADRRIGAQRMLTYMVSALSVLTDGLEQAPTTPVLFLSTLPEAERRQVVEGFNSTQKVRSEDKLIHELFEEQVLRTPNAIAAVYEELSVTYMDLNARANRVARCLRNKGVGPDECVGICVERSIDLIVGLLGILKAGGAYVPMDPSYPDERLRYLLRSASTRVILTQEPLKNRLIGEVTEVVALDSDWGDTLRWSSENLDFPEGEMSSRNLAYVIYTSGSTGTPKGAMNEHRGVVNRLLWMQDRYKLDHSDRVLQKTPFSFDVSVWEFFWPLISGARLVFARPQGHQDPAYLRQIIDREGVTTLHFVPSMLQVFLEQHRPEMCVGLRHIVCSGEELPQTLNDKCLKCLPQAQLSNLYGPTEAAVDVTVWECQVDPEAPRVPLGEPISNIQMYVLNRQCQPLPIGVPGEIYIGGVGVGRGYLSRPELTAERFLADPFSADPSARLYKTGDLGRWRADGVLDYLGRNDHQVKVRGLRIELGEIEAKLLQHHQIKEAAVVARVDETGEKNLVAYVVPRTLHGPVEQLDTGPIASYLKSILPEYMVPGAIVVLEHFPLSPNGKLDRRALPTPQSYLARQYEPPVGETESALAEIWELLLRVPHIGRRDNFFELGGHSLHGMRVIARIAEKYGVELPAFALFRYPTLESLAAYVERLRLESSVEEQSDDDTRGGGIALV